MGGLESGAETSLEKGLGTRVKDPKPGRSPHAQAGPQDLSV